MMNYRTGWWSALSCTLLFSSSNPFWFHSILACVWFYVRGLTCYITCPYKRYVCLPPYSLYLLHLIFAQNFDVQHTLHRGDRAKATQNKHISALLLLDYFAERVSKICTHQQNSPYLINRLVPQLIRLGACGQACLIIASPVRSDAMEVVALKRR